MALDTQLSHAGANAAVDALGALLNSGYARIYSATKPANANTAMSNQVKLAELRFGATAFGASVAGVATANAMTADPDAAAAGTATWARLFKSDGTTAVMDVTVGTSGTNIVLDSVTIALHATVGLSALTVTLPEAGA